MNLEAVEELIGFLKSKRDDVKLKACKEVLRLTGTSSGVSMLLLSSDELVLSLLNSINDSSSLSIEATKALVNLTTNERAQLSLNKKPKAWNNILEHLQHIKKQKTISESTLDFFHSLIKLINNLTVQKKGAENFLLGRFHKVLADESNTSLYGHDIVSLYDFVISKPEIEEKCLAQFIKLLVNVTQNTQGQEWLIGANVFPNENFLLFRRTVQFILSKDSKVRKASVKVIRNCFFEPKYHKTIISNFNSFVDLNCLADMSSSDTIVHFILYNLVGKTEEGDFFDDLDRDKQSLIENFPKFLKERIENSIEYEIEQNITIRKDIIESLFLLTGSEEGRRLLRDTNAYEIIKVYHTEEEDDEICNKVFEVVERILADEETKEQELIDISNALAGNDKSYQNVESDNTKEDPLFDIDN